MLGFFDFMRWQFPQNPDPKSFSALATEFLLWAEVEPGFSRETVQKYGECLKQVWRLIGDKSVSEISKTDLLRLKAYWISKNLSASRQMSLLLAFKRFLFFCRDEKQLSLALEPEKIKPPKRPRREVVFLTPEEIEAFNATIPLTTYKGEIHQAGLRLRTVVETLLGTAMRISEALSLNRDSIDFERREARIIGKGNKERTVFFTDRALLWIRRYLESRTDDCPALFVCQNGRDRLKRDDLWRYFDRHRKLAGIKKKVRPHILRHTAATTLLFNGCPVGHIKAILGHERLETTCRYYLGIDQKAAKAAHHKYLSYEPGFGGESGAA
ncbi:MAG: tyrosine-type recombinase/integrase [Terriglobales bacterium]